MNLYQILENWEHLDQEFKEKALCEAVAQIIRWQDEEAIHELINLLSDWEADDYFGTEGLRVGT